MLAMIEWHVADAWIGGAARSSSSFGWMQLIGGFAAPGFVLLAGLSVALSSPQRPSASHTIASARRGLRIVLAGYALSLFAWIVDQGGLVEPGDVASIVAAGLGLGCLAVATDEPHRVVRARAALGIAGLVSMIVAVSQQDARTWLLTRLDVLHGIGAAVIVTALALHVTRAMSPRARAAVLALAAIAVASVSVRMMGVPQAFAPSSVAGWIARSDTGASGFPLFPWLGYALLGASFAVALRARPFSLAERWALPHVARPRIALLLATVVAALTWELAPSARVVLDGSEDLRSLFRLAFNTSVIVATCAALAAIGGRAERALDVLALLGRRSLVVYCVHLELVYGLAAVPFHRALGPLGWALSVIVISAAMVALARAIERRGSARERSATHVHATA